MLALLLVVLLVARFGGWPLDRVSYWTLQRDWFLGLNHALSAWPGQVWSNLTLLGDGAVLLLLLSPLIVWRAQAWAAMLGAVPAASLLSMVGKYLAAEPRPAAVLDHHLFTIIGKPLTDHTSLPSGHSITVFAVAIALSATLLPYPSGPRHWLLLLGGLLGAATLCLSRVAVGAHWPLDLLVGAGFGWIAGLSGAVLAERYTRWWLWPKGSRTRHVLGPAILISSLFLAHCALEAPGGALVLWLSALSGTATSACLLGRSLASFRLPGNKTTK
jgi:membrane-associated phospholipid phosphatase